MMFTIFRMGCGCRHDRDFVFERPNGVEGYLMLFVRTKAQFVIKGERIITEPDTFIIFDQDTPFYYGAYEGEYINDWIRFDCNEPLTGITGTEHFNEPIQIDGRIDVAQYFRLISDCYFRSDNKQTEGLLIKALINEVFAAEKEVDGSVAHYRELLDLRGRIYAAPEEEWSISRMAKLINVSEPYLYRLYKRAFGVTCAADVINSRIDQARHYLSFTDLGVEEIAFICGYKNPVHFSRQFKQITGNSPTEWRRENMAV